ncbi:MAG: FAD-linked oxidase C-terminal domain-containing protein, partial [Candidatus Heimdallarchaeota archaeon]
EYIRKIIEYYHSVLNELNLEYVIFGHLGDNHVHVNIVPKNMEEFHLGEEVYEKFARKVVEFGGSISGEHGVGKIKKQYLKIMYSQEDLNEMRRIKKTLDPSLILNYGNIIDLEEESD